MNPYLFYTGTTLLVVRAYTRKSLTVPGIIAAILTAFIHSLHPLNTPFLLLITFYTLGTVCTRIKHDIKSRLTLSSTASPASQRTTTQVLCNSLPASICTALSVLLIPKYTAASELLLFGVVANYAATTADTLSSELGILSPSKPRLILTGNVCPPGTNGGVSLVGLLAGSLGAAVIGVVALLSGAPWEGFAGSKVGYVFFVAAIGTAGSVVDSVLGALFQETVTDVRTGKVVEAPGGGRVLIAPGERSVGKVKDEMVKIGKGEKDAKILERHKVEDRADVDELFDKGPSRKVSAGQWGLLTNNGVNLVMAGMATVGGMVSVAGVEGVVEAVGEAVKKGIEVAGLQL